MHGVGRVNGSSVNHAQQFFRQKRLQKSEASLVLTCYIYIEKPRTNN